MEIYSDVFDKAAHWINKRGNREGIQDEGAEAVSKAGIKIERLMEENRKIRRQVKKLISIFQG